MEEKLDKVELQITSHNPNQPSYQLRNRLQLLYLKISEFQKSTIIAVFDTMRLFPQTTTYGLSRLAIYAAMLDLTQYGAYVIHTKIVLFSRYPKNSTA